MRRINTLKTLAIVVLAVICAAFTSVSVSMLNVAKAETTSSQAANVVLDMNGTEANLETDKGVNTNVDNALNSGSLTWGIFPEATGATKMMFTKESVAAGETLKINFNKAYKASDLLFVKIRIATNPAAGVTEAYSLADSGCTTSAGTLTSGSGVNNYNYYLDPAKLADADGYISGIILKKTSGEASSYYFNYVELRTNSTGFDIDGEEAVLTAEGEITVRADNTFNNTGSLDWGMFPEATGATKLSRTESNVAVGKTVTVKFASPIKAAANKGINVRLATENFQCVLQGYSLGDTAFVYSASVVKATGASVSNFNVVMPSEILADSDGYVRGFVIKNVSGSEGILDFNYVNVTELSSKYDLDGTEATIESAGEVQIHADNTFNNTGSLDWGIFPEAEGKTKLMRTAGGINEGETFDITFAVPMKAESGKVVRVRMASENAHGVTAGYALSDSSAEKVAGWKAVGGGNVNFMLVLDSVVLADGDGYIRGIRIKRTSGSSVVYDVDYVELGDAEDIKLDMDLTEAWLESNGQKWTNVNVDNNPYLPVFGDGTTKQIWADDIKGNEPLTIKFANKYKASNFGTVEVRMAVSNWHENNDIETFGYSLGDTAYENSAGSVKSGFQNPIVTLTLDAAKLADEEGYIGGIVLKKTQTDNELTGSVFVDYVKLVLKEISTEQPKIDEKPAEDLVIDGDTTNLWLESNGQKWTNVNVDNNPYLPVFGDGTTKQIWADDIKGNEPLTIKFANKYKASNFGTVEVRMAVGNWHENNDIETFGYSLGDTAYENSAGSVKSGFQNPIVTLTLDAAKLADEEGYIGGIVLKKTQTNNEFTGSMFVDYVKLALSNKQTGDVDEQPESNITVDFDGENAWLDGRKDIITADNDSGAPFFISDGANGSTKQTYTEYEDEAAFIVKLGRRYKAEFFDYVKIRLGVSNWGGGNIVSVSGYAAGDNGFAKNAGSVKSGYGTFPKTLKLKASLLADEDGYISEIVIKKTHSSDGKKSSLGFDYLEFCLVGSEPEPVVAGEYTEKDISEVMPIGAGKEFNLVSYEEALNAVSIAASVKASAYDKLDFVLTPSYSGKFSAYILMKATTDKDTHENGGIFFWFTDTSVSVGAVSDGVTNTEEVSLSELPARLFASGKATKVAVAAIPYQVEGSQEGYYCAVYLDGSETPSVEIYLENSSLTTGVYTNICMQDLGNDFSIKLASTKETPVSAEEIMNVKVATTSGKSEFKTPRAGLTLTRFEVAGETVGNLVIEGDATFDKATKYLTFTKAGTVKVYYTVKNAFGEFKSNELTITYVSDEKPTESGSGKSGGCFGTITGVSLTAIFAAAAAIIIAKKKKND